jgi:hypothetical protein
VVRVTLELAIIVGLALGALMGAVFFFRLPAVQNRHSVTMPVVIEL